jgi:hypothetical protein
MACEAGFYEFATGVGKLSGKQANYREKVLRTSFALFKPTKLTKILPTMPGFQSACWAASSKRDFDRSPHIDLGT